MSAPGLPADIAAARRYDGTEAFERHLLFPSFRAALGARRGDESIYLRAYSGGRRQADWKFADYERRVRAFARRLAVEFDVAPGDRILVGLANSGQALVVYGALLALGAVPVPVNPAEKAEFLDFVATDCAAVGIAHDALLSAPIPERLNFSIEITDDLAAVADDGWAWDGLAEPALADPALIIYTSGTTGRSKGVVLDHGNLLINVEATRRLHDMAPGHVHMTVLPLFHVNAFCFSFLTPLYSGARLVLNRGFFLPDFWRIAETEGVNVVSAVPPVVRHLIDDRRDLGAEAVPASLRYFVSAAAPLSADDVARFRTRYGLRIAQAYGLSETVNFSLTVPPGVDDATYDAVMGATPRPSAGTAVFGNEVEIMGEDGNLLGEGAEGEIVIRGWNVMQGYHANPEGNAAAFAGGWFHTGDKGMWRTAGGCAFRLHHRPVERDREARR